MKHEPATRTHHADDPPPTVIHHPEENETLLAQWLQRAMAKGPSFWVLAGGTLAVMLGLGYFVSGMVSSPSTDSRAWAQIMLAKSPEDLQRIAETEASTPAGGWATLMAASARYREALQRLPADQESAKPMLTQALDGFKSVEENAKGDEMLRRLAMLGEARTHETRDELDEAIAVYEKIAQNWPKTEDGIQASARAKRLKQPEAIAFYKKFSTFKPKASASTLLGPRGTNRLNLPAGHPALDGPTMLAPPLTNGVPAGSIPTPAAGELPKDVFQSSGAAKAQPRDDDLPEVHPDEPRPKSTTDKPK
ncbi:MAG: hypothetical protein JWN86_404 [Planctomycetota bacterium]|nr:hypothetical protein [Planctomycetota bacterium]